MSETIKVAVAGAGGRMGREVVKMVLADESLELVAAVDRSGAGSDAGELAGGKACGIVTADDLDAALAQSQPDVLVDFTVPSVVYGNTVTAIKHGVRPVVGATGFTPQQIEELDGLCREAGIGGLIAPNFSIGAILMMQFAAKAAEYLPHVEIIETHGDQKLDAPSGTAIKTAELIAKGREKIKQGNPNEEEILPGARGGEYEGFRIHSLRLPGVFAQQEVVFGGYGQSLKIRHDSYERAGYMPGVNIGIKKVMEYSGMIYGFEHLM
ncbi:4-hydroxy-tetrahydrodipicolinate reductase [Saccharibacillus sp. CPCC 101409]|uniref:4-hydroxy-tetrahydrodipicolinate reductase n=1 Tax=Saccharibacillus sp. CPCC 101409 TaxID=3058041 RepID=UPI0026730325|nr:4-hydroxy-tetrahydrodipicolinate reductase [Saccharibacillus sp. CPCC 101409]MDO3409634.1 4-hydroxy-tetrahydrodipicolinate reductase [Saccharibacillus sp. CPCC 101409]